MNDRQGFRVVYTHVGLRQHAGTPLQWQQRAWTQAQAESLRDRELAKHPPGHYSEANVRECEMPLSFGPRHAWSARPRW